MSVIFSQKHSALKLKSSNDLVIWPPPDAILSHFVVAENEHSNHSDHSPTLPWNGGTS